MAISADQKYSLKDAGWDWTEDCYLILHDLTEEVAQAYDAAKKDKENELDTLKRLTNLIESLFVSGKGMNNGHPVDMVKEDIASLPVKVRWQIFGQMVGATIDDPKGETPTTRS